MEQATRTLVLVTALGWLACGCTSTNGVVATRAGDVPSFRGATQVDDSDLPSPEDFLAVDDAMRAYVRDVLLPIDSQRERLRRLASDLIVYDGPMSIRYVEERTSSAREVFARREGNCLSVTALVVQLSRLAGFEAQFQDVPVLPQWRVASGTYVVERHVDALVRVGPRDAIIDFRPPQAATYTHARTITDESATAQYFGNLGVERFTAGALEHAYRLYRRGLQVDPTAAALWLNLGVVLSRNEQPEDAEFAYRRALALEPDNLSALNNLALTLADRGAADEASGIRARVERYRLLNPYYLYWLGEQALQSGDPAAAKKQFAKAVEKMPHEADFHFAQARASLAAGRIDDAERHLKSALEFAQTDAIRRRYRMKYDALVGQAPPGT